MGKRRHLATAQPYYQMGVDEYRADGAKVPENAIQSLQDKLKELKNAT